MATKKIKQINSELGISNNRKKEIEYYLTSFIGKRSKIDVSGAIKQITIDFPLSNERSLAIWGLAFKLGEMTAIGNLQKQAPIFMAPKADA